MGQGMWEEAGGPLLSVLSSHLCVFTSLGSVLSDFSGGIIT